MRKPKERLSATAITFHAPDSLVEKLDQLASREMVTRAALLRRISAKAIEESTAA